MLKTYTWPRYASGRAPELDRPGVRRVPLVVVGAGPVGLSAAIDAALRGLPAVLLDEDSTVSVGSRGVCYAKRTLEIFDRLGVGDAVVGKGVTWNVGRTFHGDSEVFSFNLLPEAGHRRPGMVNLQQYHLEQYLVERTGALPGIDLRWQHKVVGVSQNDSGARVDVETADGRYTLECDWLIVADGAKSPVRAMLGLESEGQVFRDRFLIADIRMRTNFPPERWFWFDPPFHPGQSVLLHRQADDVWRIDFQLGWEADPEEEKKPERVTPRIRAMLGDDRPFELEWVSVYTFQCRRLDRFVHGRVIFAGDAAHQVSPFGARGANSGFQDTDNLCWKLARVLRGQSPASLLDSYDRERVEAADENILNSTRATDFITPKSHVSRVFRDAVLDLSRRYPFARRLVNSGRLSLPTTHRASPLSTLDRDAFSGAMVPGAPATDAPIRLQGRAAWLLNQLGGRFNLLVFAPVAPRWLDEVTRSLGGELSVALVVPQSVGDESTGLVVIEDAEGLVSQRYEGAPGTAYLLRPDQHVAARWRAPEVAEIREALARAQGRGGY